MNVSFKMINRKPQYHLSKKLFLYYIFILLCQYEFDLSAYLRSVRNSAGARKRRKKVRVLWSEVSRRISDIQFRRMFRMPRDCFDNLCQAIIAAVGEREFCSELYINAFLREKDNMYIAHEKTSGGYISGEIKLAITLRLLAGGDSYDLGVIFDISSRTCERILYEVLENWIINTKIGEINIEDYLNDVSEMEKVSQGFSTRSNGILIGAIGAIDGWLVMISKPTLFRDVQPNATAFYSRKGFYALNVQVIVDHRKKVRWVSYSHKGASHDSSCFRDTYLYNHILKDKEEFLHEHKFFFLGDSAYSLESFMITPYLQAAAQTNEDAFNVYHSSARITVECAFGEIDLRWGIFWKRLMCSLEHASIIIEGAMCLHNYLVDYREMGMKSLLIVKEKFLFKMFEIYMLLPCRWVMIMFS